jgi:hypothetical protein
MAMRMSQIAEKAVNGLIMRESRPCKTCGCLPTIETMSYNAGKFLQCKNNCNPPAEKEFEIDRPLSGGFTLIQDLIKKWNESQKV